MQIGLNEIRNMCKADNRRLKKRIWIVGLVLLALFCVFVCSRTTALGFVSPLQALDNLFVALRLQLSRLVDGALYANRRLVMADQEYYLETLGRFQAAVTIVALGAALSVAGAVFQCAFRNPIATPSMIGTSSGIRIINMILVLMYSTGAYTMIKERMIISYIGSLVILGILMGVARLMSKQRVSSADILLIGTVFTRIAMQVVSYVQANLLEDDDYLVLQELNIYGSGTGTTKGVGIALIVIVAALIPIYLTRMSLNTLSFGDEDARCLGIRASVLRGISLICSTLLSVSTLVYLGDVGMLSMLIPVVCRYTFGSDTRYLLVGSAFCGALLMLICRIIVSAFAFNEYLSVISIGTIVEVIAAPLMIFVIFKNRRGWE